MGKAFCRCWSWPIGQDLAPADTEDPTVPLQDEESQEGFCQWIASLEKLCQGSRLLIHFYCIVSTYVAGVAHLE